MEPANGDGTAVEALPETAFQREFERGAEVVAEAHGGIDLAGDADAADGGRVLLLTLPFRARVSAASRPDGVVRVVGFGTGEYRIGEESPTGTDLDVLAATTRELRRTSLPVSGVDLLVECDIPAEAGLGRREAVALALLGAFLALRNARLTMLEGMLLVRSGSVGFLRRPLRLGALFVAAFGTPGESLVADTRALEHERLAMPPILEAALLLADESASPARPAPLDPERRVAHLVEESRRVSAVRGALVREDLAELGALLRESRRSQLRALGVAESAAHRLASRGEEDEGAVGVRVGLDGRSRAVLLLSRAGQARETADRVAAGGGGRRILLGRSGEGEVRV